MRIGSICTGLGRLDAAVSALAGDAPIAWCAEPDPLCRKVLSRQVLPLPRIVGDDEPPTLDLWPEQRIYQDARQAFDADPVDFLVGGTPCQDLSAAGRRAGADGERSGLLTLIPDLADRLGPVAVCWENVPGAATASGPGGRGTALGWLVDALTARGWATAHTVIPASCVGAPHLRRRLFLLAVRSDAVGPGMARSMWPADRLTRCALTRLACEAPVKAGCLDAEGPRISWAGGGRFQGRPLINLDGCDSVGDARRELCEALASLAQDTVAPVLRKRLQRAVEGRPGVVLGDVEAWDAVDFTVKSTVTGRVLSWVRVGNDGILHYVAGGRRAELPVWPGRGENGLGERERGIINKFLDLVQDDIHNHTFTEENNR